MILLLLFIVQLYGLKKVSILDNGIHDWKEKGYPTTDSKTNPKVSSFLLRVDQMGWVNK